MFLRQSFAKLCTKLCKPLQIFANLCKPLQSFAVTLGHSHKLVTHTKKEKNIPAERLHTNSAQRTDTVETTNFLVKK
jgi:hypothetical protein